MATASRAVMHGKERRKMLKPAQLYETQLREQNIKSWYSSDNMFWNGGSGDSEIKLPESNYDSHNFVSVDKSGNVIGYISYAIDWSSMSADSFGMISFDKGNLEFVKDLYAAIYDIFGKYHMNRMSWWCYADNPAIRGYRNFIKRHGGRECGYLRQYTRLQDGKLHDSVLFEILASEFKGKPERSEEK